MAIALSTEDKLEYQFYRARNQIIQFRVKSPNDAHVALTSGPSATPEMFEVFIGGWKNTKSIIRKNGEKPDVAEADTEGILNADEFRGFWIKWGSNDIRVGRENEPEPFLAYENPEPIAIGYVGVCTGWGAQGDWLLEERCIYGDHDAGDEEDVTPAPSAPESDEIWLSVEDGIMPPNAFVGGQDDDGESLYVGRAAHENGLIPGKVKPSHGVCYVAWGNKEHAKNEYQVLCISNGKWQPADCDAIPSNAIAGGESEEGEPLFVGRATHNGNITPGKIHPTHNCLYIAYGGEEVPIRENFEILTRDD